MQYSPELHPPEPTLESLNFSRQIHHRPPTPKQLATSTLLTLLALLLMPLPASAEPLNLWPGENHSLDTLRNDHAQIQGYVTYENGKLGKAFYFDGGGFMHIDNIAGFTATSFTFDLWIRPELSPWFEIPVLSLYYSRGDTSVSIISDGSLCARIEWRHGGCTFSTGPGMFKTGELSHLTIVKAGGEMRLYKNGVRIAGGAASCCLKIESPIYFGGRYTSTRSERVMFDEIRYHAQPMSDEEVFALYNEYTVSYPDEALLAELEAAYALIESLQQEVASLNQTNSDLEYQIVTLENQNTVYISQITELESQLGDMAERVHDLESQLETLETRVSGLDQQVADLQQQIEELKSLVGGLESQITYLEDKVRALQAELDALKQTLNLSLNLLEEDFRATFHDPVFEIPGNNSEEKLENLVQAIIDLNKGRKMGLYKALRYSDRPHPRHGSLLWWLRALHQHHKGNGGYHR